MRNVIRSVLLAVVHLQPGIAFAADAFPNEKPTVVLVHGAFAESSSWDRVIGKLSDRKIRVIAASNPLRGVAGDAASVSAVVQSVRGPVVLVGHSYGGAVVTEVANDAPNVTALVYVAGFLPDTGESSGSLSEQFAGSTLGSALAPIALANGDTDLYIRSDKYHDQFAADVSASEASLMAVTQRPVSQAALSEKSGVPSWKRLPSYVIYGSADKNIPAEAMKFMAERAGARRTVVLEGASHALMLSHPAEVSDLIFEAVSNN